MQFYIYFDEYEGMMKANGMWYEITHEHWQEMKDYWQDIMSLADDEYEEESRLWNEITRIVDIYRNP